MLLLRTAAEDAALAGAFQISISCTVIGVDVPVDGLLWCFILVLDCC
jgi:hypothetical protein